MHVRERSFVLRNLNWNQSKQFTNGGQRNKEMERGEETRKLLGMMGERGGRKRLPYLTLEIDTSEKRTRSELLSFSPSLSRKGSKSLCNAFCSPAEHCRLPPNNVLQKNHYPHTDMHTQDGARTPHITMSGERGGRAFLWGTSFARGEEKGGTGTKTERRSPDCLSRASTELFSPLWLSHL